MANDPFVIKQNDTREELVRTLKDSSGTVIDLTGATVKFTMRSKADGSLKIDEGAVTVTDATGGICKYTWQTGDTDTVGQYEGEFNVTLSGGGEITVPNDGYISITVVEELS